MLVANALQQPVRARHGVQQPVLAFPASDQHPPAADRVHATSAKSSRGDGDDATMVPARLGPAVGVRSGRQGRRKLGAKALAQGREGAHRAIGARISQQPTVHTPRQRCATAGQGAVCCCQGLRRWLQKGFSCSTHLATPTFYRCVGRPPQQRKQWQRVSGGKGRGGRRRCTDQPQDPLWRRSAVSRPLLVPGVEHGR